MRRPTTIVEVNSVGMVLDTSGHFRGSDTPYGIWNACGLLFPVSERGGELSNLGRGSRSRATCYWHLWFRDHFHPPTLAPFYSYGRDDVPIENFLAVAGYLEQMARPVAWEVKPAGGDSRGLVFNLDRREYGQCRYAGISSSA